VLAVFTVAPAPDVVVVAPDVVVVAAPVVVVAARVVVVACDFVVAVLDELDPSSPPPHAAATRARVRTAQINPKMRFMGIPPCSQ
jgi:hypothetical protein